MTEWQPIKTAPKDGTPILAAKPGDDEATEVCWVYDSWRSVWETDEDVTIWTPKPKPPPSPTAEGAESK